MTHDARSEIIAKNIYNLSADFMLQFELTPAETMTQRRIKLYIEQVLHIVGVDAVQEVFDATNVMKTSHDDPNVAQTEPYRTEPSPHEKMAAGDHDHHGIACNNGEYLGADNRATQAQAIRKHAVPMTESARKELHGLIDEANPGAAMSRLLRLIVENM